MLTRGKQLAQDHKKSTQILGTKLHERKLQWSVIRGKTLKGHSKTLGVEVGLLNELSMEFPQAPLKGF